MSAFANFVGPLDWNLACCETSKGEPQAASAVFF
jgi:hypothetical protein